MARPVPCGPPRSARLCASRASTPRSRTTRGNRGNGRRCATCHPAGTWTEWQRAPPAARRAAARPLCAPSDDFPDRLASCRDRRGGLVDIARVCRRHLLLCGLAPPGLRQQLAVFHHYRAAHHGEDRAALHATSMPWRNFASRKELRLVDGPLALQVEEHNVG